MEALSEASEGLPSSYRKWLPHLGGSFSLWQAATHNPSRVHFRPAEDWAFRHLDYMPAPWALGPPLPLDYMTDYAGGPVFGLARPHEVGRRKIWWVCGTCACRNEWTLSCRTFNIRGARTLLVAPCNTLVQHDMGTAMSTEPAHTDSSSK